MTHIDAVVSKSITESRNNKLVLPDWAFVGGMIVILLALTSLPYMFSFLNSPPDKQFMGVILDAPDHLQYFSWMRDFSHSNLVSNKLTPEPNPPIFFNLMWWGLGRLSNIFGLDIAEIYQVLRVVATIFLLIFLFRLMSWLIPDQTRRRTAYLVALLTSGFGWVLILLKYTLMNGITPFPNDIFIAEGNTFLGILGYPHFIAALTYILVFDLVLRGEKAGMYRYSILAGFFALFLGWQHTYDLITVYGILAAYIGLRILRDHRIPVFTFLSLIVIGLISFWPALYSVWLTSANPIWKEVLSQFVNAGIFSPTPVHLPILLGLAFILAVFGLVKKQPLKIKQLSDNDLFVIGWFLASFLLIYLPVDYQIHLLNGWQIPIAILATGGFYDHILPFLGKLAKNLFPPFKEDVFYKIAPALLILAIIPTNLYLLGWRFVELSKHDYPYFLYNDEVQALQWLSNHGKPDEVVLSSLTIGQYIPAYTGMHAFLAHWAQTVDFYGKSKMVDEFYSTTITDLQRQSILKEFNVHYVFFGPAERQIGNFNPAQSSYLKIAYSSKLVEVFQVEDQSANFQN
jgi:hypothetical protein